MREVTASYLAPARLEDQLVVTTEVGAIGGARIDMEQDGAARAKPCLVECRVALACLGAGGRAARIPAEVRAALGRLPPSRDRAPRQITGFSTKARANALWSAQSRDRTAAAPEQALPRSRQAMQPDTLAAAQQIDFSLLALFFRATFTVKLVMLVLIAASFWSWAIIIQKLLDLRRVRERGARPSTRSSGRASRSTSSTSGSGPTRSAARRGSSPPA